MENATKALGMAAGVLIAIMVIALIYSVASEFSETSKQEEMALKAAQTAEFNKQYESYEKGLMRGTDVVSVANKAIDNNYRYQGDEQYQIHVQITLIKAIDVKEDDGTENGKQVTILPGVYNESSDEYNLLINSPNAIYAFKQKFFRCQEIRYNSDARVNYLSFIELPRAEGL